MSGKIEDMNRKDYLIAKKLKEKLSEVLPSVVLIIFGSRARGDEDEYSDMDVAIEVPFINSKLKRQINNIIWEVGFENFIVIVPLIFTRDEINNSPLRSAQIIKNIYEEGIRI